MDKERLRKHAQSRYIVDLTGEELLELLDENAALRRELQDSEAKGYRRGLEKAKLLLREREILYANEEKAARDDSEDASATFWQQRALTVEGCIDLVAVELAAPDTEAPDVEAALLGLYRRLEDGQKPLDEDIARAIHADLWEVMTGKAAPDTEGGSNDD